MVQRRAARYVLHRYHYKSSVGQMLQGLGWPSLQQRREQARLSMFYKIHNNLVAVNRTKYLIPMALSSRTAHQFSYQIPHSRCDYHKYSFFPCTIRAWNCLPITVVQAPTCVTFKARLAVVYAAGTTTY